MHDATRYLIHHSTKRCSASPCGTEPRNELLLRCDMIETMWCAGTFFDALNTNVAAHVSTTSTLEVRGCTAKTRSTNEPMCAWAGGGEENLNSNQSQANGKTNKAGSLARNKLDAPFDLVRQPTLVSCSAASSRS
ncbi:hypothetical protein J6590_008958 [Homalodisca vitripennis]|nr:hypothetical protein J6590_008958 [Homalodisca vitripennis]